VARGVERGTMTSMPRSIRQDVRVSANKRRTLAIKVETPGGDNPLTVETSRRRDVCIVIASRAKAGTKFFAKNPTFLSGDPKQLRGFARTIKKGT